MFVCVVEIEQLELECKKENDVAARERDLTARERVWRLLRENEEERKKQKKKKCGLKEE